MDKRLHLLETFPAEGSDGLTYKVHGYEHLVRTADFIGATDAWESTGEAEYKLSSGHPVEVTRDGSLCVAATGVRLKRRQPS